jgi:tetratricopeptide (TPR) repeat protein
MTRICHVALIVALAWAGVAHAGLYYSGEVFADLPSQWRGFLLDQRTLRNIAVAETPKMPASPARLQYLEEKAKLLKKAKAEKLTADEIADLGAIHVRLGEISQAVPLLRKAHQDHPNHFRIAANLGTAWHLQGDLNQAAICLQQSVRLAPGKYQKIEETHLKLVQQRLRDAKATAKLDDLFGIRFLNDKGAYEAGKLATAEKKKLPAHAVATAQYLALSLPADGRLLWQLAELANAHGDFKSAAAMMDGCVTAFNMNDATLRKHRQIVREAVDKLPKAEVGPKMEHEQKHVDSLGARSKRPLVSRLDKTPLPPVSATEVNSMPWELLADTVVDTKFRPTFPTYLKELDGKQVTLNGFMQPLSEDTDAGAFMFIEYPVGCWYCEMPEVTSIVYVELPRDKSTPIVRGLVRVTGRLRLNANDPEDFLYAVRQAKVSGVD